MEVYKAYREERHYYRKQDLERSCLDTFRQEIEKLGFSPDASVALARSLFSNLHYRDDLNPELLEHMIKESGAGWKRAENTIPAKECWEDYFTKNPHLRPKHIIYYDGDPTSAVYELQQGNDIGKADTSEQDGNLLGFDDHHVTDMKKDPRANLGYDELVDMASKIISEHYAGSEETEAKLGT